MGNVGEVVPSFGGMRASIVKLNYTSELKLSPHLVHLYNCDDWHTCLWQLYGRDVQTVQICLCRQFHHRHVVRKAHRARVCPIRMLKRWNDLCVLYILVKITFTESEESHWGPYWYNRGYPIWVLMRQYMRFHYGTSRDIWYTVYMCGIYVKLWNYFKMVSFWRLSKWHLKVLTLSTFHEMLINVPPYQHISNLKSKPSFQIKLGIMKNLYVTTIM